MFTCHTRTKQFRHELVINDDVDDLVLITVTKELHARHTGMGLNTGPAGIPSNPKQRRLARVQHFIALGCDQHTDRLRCMLHIKHLV